MIDWTHSLVQFQKLFQALEYAAKTKHISCQYTNLGGTSFHEKKQVQDTQPDTSLQHPPHDGT